MRNNWPSIKLGRVVQTVSGAGFPHEHQGAEEGPYPFFKVSDFNRPGNEIELRSCTNWVDDATLLELGARLVPVGAVLFPKVGAALLGNARRIATRASAFDNNVMALIPTGVDARFLYYLMSSMDLGEIGNPGPVPSIGEWTVREIRVSLPALRVQRAIGRFVDRETARIDEVIAARNRLLGLVRVRKRAYADGLVREAGRPSARVKSVVHRITSGPRGWAGYVSDEGDPFVRITNVSRESIELSTDDLLRVSAPPGPEAERTRVVEGDVVVSITADVGSVGVVEQEFDGGFVSQHLALMRPNRRMIEPRWLALALFSSSGQAQLDSARYGGTKTQLSLDDVAEVRLPLPSLDDQRAVLARWLQMGSAAERLRAAITRQIQRLQERRQALITAAVAGELAVSRTTR